MYIHKKLSHEQLDDFYQSKYDYFKIVSGYSALLVGVMEIAYFLTDCMLYGRFSTETIIPRLAILGPMAVFVILFQFVNDYKLGTWLFYLLPHSAMWCTIWAIYNLQDRNFASEGFIIIHFAFLVVGLATPLIYHIPFHLCVFLNILISNIFIHYSSLSMMIALAIPVYIGVVVMLFIMEMSYVDQYLIKKELEICSVRDQLTGVFNRYKLQEYVDPDTERFLGDESIVVVMTDIDHFKAVNDSYGHEAGDEILKSVADQIVTDVFNDDLVIRWGGEEFVIILYGYDINRAMAFAERLRVEIEASDNGICPITISVGLCKYNGDDTYHEAIDKADNALYYAKEHGRNRLINYSDLQNLKND